MRYMKSFDIEMFIENLREKIKKFLMKNTEAVDSKFDKFMLTLTSVVKKHVPFRHALRREKRLQQKLRSIQLLLKSIKRKTKCMQI